VNAAASLQSYHPNIRVEREEHVATVTIDRVESKNACTGDMWVALGATFRDLGHSGARVVLLAGAGGDFCAGADLSGANDGGGGASADRAPRPFGSMVDAMRVLGEVVIAIHDCPVPTGTVVETIAAGPPIALSATKRELDNASTGSLAQALEVEALAQSLNVQTDDLREALIAYAERRPPIFKGR
jgi:2-(1,2-epoxy-1,2-dihydrophenyl)acetyl-CoA isomerase